LLLLFGGHRPVTSRSAGPSEAVFVVCARFDRQRATVAPVSFVLNLAVAAAVTALVVALPPQPAMGQAPPEQASIHFDIPSQPLSAALERYGDATGREVLYDSGLALGRHSMAVVGPMTPEAALQTLLTGTGLGARFMADGTFVLMPLRAAERQDDAVSALVRERYYARIQGRLREALCTNTDTRPGSYRLVALFWIGTSGRVARYERLGSTGLPARDRNVDAALARLTIGTPPPAGFAQPVLIMIVPDRPGVTLGCEIATLQGRAP
jgi:hypothetical protein